MTLPLLISVLVELAAGPTRAALPPSVTMEGLTELMREGEVLFLPKHDLSTFNALLVTRSEQSCREMERAMLDIKSYPKRWNAKAARVKKVVPHGFHYELELNIALAPTLQGVVTNPQQGRVVFHDVETGADFVWTLIEAQPGCHMLYSMQEKPGKPSGFVGVVRAVEPQAGDGVSFAAAVTSARGYAKPEATKRGRPQQAGVEAATEIASRGTLIRFLRDADPLPKVLVKRRIDKPVDEVLWSIRDRRRYDDKLDVVGGVKDKGRTVRWSLGAFGGRANFDTDVVERGSVQDGAGLQIEETVTGGDLKKGAGRWTWTVRKVDGGTDVELLFDLDIAPGSSIMMTLAGTDPVMRESLAMHVALSFAGRLIGGKPLGPRNFASSTDGQARNSSTDGQAR